LSQGRFGTPPVSVTGGEAGLQALLAIQNAVRQSQGASAIDIAIKNAQIQHLQQQQKTQQLTEKNQDNPEKFEKDWKATFPKANLGEWETNFGNGSFQRGDVDKDTGTWTPNPTTGKFYNYGSTPDELSSDAISQVPADSFIRRHDTMPKDATVRPGPRRPTTRQAAVTCRFTIHPRKLGRR